MQRRSKCRSCCVVIVGVIILGVVGVSAFFAVHFTGQARRPVGDIPPQLPRATATVSFPARDGIRLSGWILPREKTATAVILLHGHGSNRQQMIARAHFFYESGFSVLLYDARGHGLSGGDRVSAGWYETSDLLGALDFMRSNGFRQFGCLGASQGGATILLTGTRLPTDVQWVIVESTYPTMRDALDRRFRMDLRLPGWLAGIFFVPIAEWRLHVSIDDIAPIRNIHKLSCPTFVLGGERDRHTLAQSTRALYEAAKEPKDLWIVPGAGHVDLYGFAKQEYERRILAFISKVQSPRR
ncbi:MAG: alpha/beta fold hydrolase [Opitutaceae bacterium]|jgi:fermentation-respiration switch protein FrsA (DUF1100 family)